uniref:MRN complex-interacting protein n=1 Tax=Erigeron canadensis TaxID=72917 RepID=UPI001CB9B161|nr:MRN complex-interacting protein [Erigeron canadensis]
MTSALVFMALECFKCSTMQVKQRKKSSNKWICVICNEKQSVRKVYSQGSMAKHVRAFVQQFNMSRAQFLHHHQRQPQPHDDQQIQPIRKRTDWSEYLDGPPAADTYDQGDPCEPNVVTELPKAWFKKPKLADRYSPPSGFGGQNLRKPVFGKRAGKKKINISDKEPTTVMKESFKRAGENQPNIDNADHGCVYQTSSSVMSKLQRPNSKSNAWKEDETKVDQSFAYTGASSLMTKLKKPVSKWNDFIDDDDDDLQLESRCPEINNDVFKTKVSDEIVEDDVHPDFL